MTNIVINFIVHIITKIFQLVMHILHLNSPIYAEVELIEITTALIDLRRIELNESNARRFEEKEVLKQIILKNVYPLPSSEEDVVYLIKLLIPSMRLVDENSYSCVLKMEESFGRLSIIFNGVFFQLKEATDALNGLKLALEQFAYAQKAAKDILVEIEKMSDTLLR